MQPPPRGCVLKQPLDVQVWEYYGQPPPRGCVLKPALGYESVDELSQPPPRGCVLKPCDLLCYLKAKSAAASARLCVETLSLSSLYFFLCSRLRAAVC